MDFSDYQREAYKYAKYPIECGMEFINKHKVDSTYLEWEPISWLYPALALAEEAGEVSGKLAKYIRKQDFCKDTFDKLRDDVEKELGDVLWQVAALATELGLDLGLIAVNNLTKLDDRQERGVIVGEGDNR